ncbi:MAG: PqqD family protein [Actinomycetota bacterium]|nr:PqqD family protein [Actinomycetota bacterium]
MARTDKTRALRSVVRHGDVAWVQVDREVVVHHHRHGKAYLLEPMAALLWQCLDGESPLAEVFADIADVVAVPVDTVANDCLPVVQSWLAAEIVADDSSPTVPSPSIRTWRRLVDPPNA